MEIAALRGKLHEYIDVADEPHLSAIYLLVENNIPNNTDDLFDEQTMDTIYERREDHRNGSSRSFSVKESLESIRQHKG